MILTRRVRLGVMAGRTSSRAVVFAPALLLQQEGRGIWRAADYATTGLPVHRGNTPMCALYSDLPSCDKGAYIWVMGTDTNLRVVGYARLSRASEESTSIERQREVIERTAEARGWTLVGVHEDIDLSGTTDREKRPGLDAALRTVESGEADALLVWRLDRACRGVGQFVGWLDAGVNVISATEPIDTTSPMGRAMAQVLQVFAELEARTTGLRSAASHEYLRRVGRWTGGPCPYGYRVIDHPEGTGKALAVDEDEAAVIRRMSDLVLSGETSYGVAKMLNEEGVPTKRGGQWQATTVERTLTADSTMGRVTHKGEPVRGDDGLPLTPWTPVLPASEVERLRSRLGHKARTRQHKPRVRADYLLSGLLYCSSCGRVLHGRNRAGEVVYVCSGAARGKRCDNGVLITETSAAAEVVDEYLRVVGPFKMTYMTEETVEATGLAEVSAAIADIAAEMTKPGADLVTLAATLADLHERRESLSAERPEVIVHRHESDDTLAEHFATLDIAGKRAMLAQVVERVTVKPGQRGRRTQRCDIEWRG